MAARNAVRPLCAHATYSYASLGNAREDVTWHVCHESSSHAHERATKKRAVSGNERARDLKKGRKGVRERGRQGGCETVRGRRRERGGMEQGRGKERVAVREKEGEQMLTRPWCSLG